MPGIEKTETILIDSEDKMLISHLRVAVGNEFKRAWVLMHVSGDKYTLTACNEWCGEIDQEVAKEMKRFVKKQAKKFMS